MHNQILSYYFLYLLSPRLDLFPALDVPTWPRERVSVDGDDATGAEHAVDFSVEPVEVDPVGGLRGKQRI